MAGRHPGRKLNSSKYLSRLLCYFFSILFIMFAAMVAVYAITSRNTKEAVYDKIRSNLIASAKLIDAQTGVVQNIGLNLFKTDTIKFYFKKDAVEVPQVWAEQYRIKNLLAQNEAILGEQISLLYAFFVNGDRVYTSAGLYDRSFFFDQICRYERYDEDFWSDVLEKPLTIRVLPSQPVQIRNNLKEDAIPVITASRIEGETAVIAANLSAEQTASMLKGSSLTKNTGFLIVDQEGNRILETIGFLEKEDYDRLFQTEDGGSFRKNCVFFHTSSTSGWTYITLVPENEIAGLTNAYMAYILLVGAGLTAVGVFLALLYSIRLYRPINSIIQELGSPADGKEKRKTDDIKLLQSGIDILLKKEKQYKKNADEYAAVYIGHTLQLLANGMKVEEEEMLDENLRQYGFQEGNYVCVSLFFEFSEHFFSEFSELERNLMFEKLKEILWELLEKKAVCFVISMQGGLYSSLMNGTVLECTERLWPLKKIFEEDSEYYKVRIGVSAVFARPSDFGRAYGQSLRALSLTDQDKGFSISEYDGAEKKEEIVFSFYDQKKIVGSIKLGKKDQMERVLHEVLDINNLRGVSGRNQAELYRQLFSVGQRCMEGYRSQDMDLNGETRFRMELLSEENLGTPERMRELILNYFSEIFDLVNGKELQNGSRQIELIKEYIQNNIQENLSLYGIASVHGMSAKYLSHLFKQKTGVNLTEYVNAVRLNRAKELLKTSEKKIGEISVMAGFDSRTTFLRVFKKYEGCSPKEYREMLRKGAG